ncbi:DUF1467 family protein [Kordiimonas sp.]|uniref:DUF1467 family protein n=1 Tax=Kordiimonas sp. TaxID=1970157 RepID=UPI003A8DF9A3
MNIATVILVYVIAWWMVFFCMLPVGIRSQTEANAHEAEGVDPGAPVNPNLKKKILITTFVALVLTVAYYFLATSDLITFRAPRP